MGSHLVVVQGLHEVDALHAHEIGILTVRSGPRGCAALAAARAAFSPSEEESDVKDYDDDDDGAAERSPSVSAFDIVVSFSLYGRAGGCFRESTCL